jgi:3-oxoadipate CoA-transferase alpha subunit
MIDKRVASIDAAVADVKDGMTIMIGGFGTAGMPMELLDGLIRRARATSPSSATTRDNAETGIALLLKERRVRKVICSFPRQTDSWHFDKLYKEKAVELELRAPGQPRRAHPRGGAGIGSLPSRPRATERCSPEGKETRAIDGRHYVLEYTRSTPSSRRLVKRPSAATAGGNLVYRKTAAIRTHHGRGRALPPWRRSSASCRLGEIDPEAVVTPGIFVLPRGRGGPCTTRGAGARRRREREEIRSARRDAGARSRATFSRRRLCEPRHRACPRSSPITSRKDREIILHTRTASSAWDPRPRRDQEDRTSSTRASSR